MVGVFSLGDASIEEIALILRDVLPEKEVTAGKSPVLVGLLSPGSRLITVGRQCAHYMNWLEGLACAKHVLLQLRDQNSGNRERPHAKPPIHK